MKPEVTGAEPRYRIDSVDNALRLLCTLASDRNLRVKDAAELLQVSTGTAHRLLAMLAYRGFVTQDGATKAYSAGPMLLSIGLRAANRLNLTSQMRPALERLHAQLDETVHLAVLYGADVLYLDGIESTKTLKVASRAGSIQPAHCTSVGKALLATIGRDQLVRLYPDEELTAVTGHSIASRTQLLLELENSKARGYATNFGELEDGIISVAVAVHDGAGHAVAAIGVGTPAPRMNDRRLSELARAIREAADQVQANLVISVSSRRRRDSARGQDAGSVPTLHTAASD